MAKKPFIENKESTKLFLSIHRGNIKQSQIIDDIGLKTIKKSGSRGEVGEREEKTNNITGKTNSLIAAGFISKTGKNKGTKYCINYDGIVSYLYEIAGYKEFYLKDFNKEFADNTHKNLKKKNIAYEVKVKQFLSEYLMKYFKVIEKSDFKDYSLVELIIAYISGLAYYLIEETGTGAYFERKEKELLKQLVLLKSGVISSYIAINGLQPLKNPLISLSNNFWNNQNIML